MPANRPVPPVLELWESDGSAMRFIIWIADRAGQVRNRCQLIVAERHRSRTLSVLDAGRDTDSTGPAAGQLDQLDVEIDHLRMEAQA